MRDDRLMKSKKDIDYSKLDLAKLYDEPTPFDNRTDYIEKFIHWVVALTYLAAIIAFRIGTLAVIIWAVYQCVKFLGV